MADIAIEIHENARVNFNGKAREFYSLVESKSGLVSPRKGKLSTSQTKPDPYAPHVEATVTEADIVGDIRRREAMPHGLLTKVSLIRDGNCFEIPDSDLEQFTAFGDGVWRLSTIANYIKREFVDDAFLDWCADQAPIEFTEYLVNKVSERVSTRIYVVPLHNVFLRRHISVLGCSLRPVSAEEIDGWVGPDREDGYVKELRKKIQGQCVVEVSVTSEEHYGKDIALQTSQDVAKAIAFYSPAMAVAGLRYNGVPLGQHVVFSHYVLAFSADRTLETTLQGITNPELCRPHVLDEQTLKDMQDLGIRQFTRLFGPERKTAFMEKVLAAILIHVKTAFTSDNSEKLAFTMIALETVLLKTESEPITQNIAERIAFLVSDNIDERKSHIANIKYAYGMRSKYFHHGQNTSDLNALNMFLQLAFVTMVHILERYDDFDTKDDFLAAIDDRKLSAA